MLLPEGVENGLYVTVGWLLGICTAIIAGVLVSGSRTIEAARRIEEDDEDADRRAWAEPVQPTIPRLRRVK